MIFTVWNRAFGQFTHRIEIVYNGDWFQIILRMKPKQ